MADYTLKVSTRLIVSLDLPTNWVEVQKAINGMQQELIRRNARFESDDFVTVVSDGETLQFVADLDPS